MRPRIIAHNGHHLKTLVEEAMDEHGLAVDLNHIDVSGIVDFSGLFTDLTNFNGDISQWNTARGADMSGMFAGSSFCGDISQWDVSNVRDMSRAFCHSMFNQDISQWDVSKVESMDYMFRGSPFNGDIFNWNVGKVTDMIGMFFESSFAQDISGWNVGDSTLIEELDTSNRHFLQAQSMSPWIVRLYLSNGTCPTDPVWEKAFELSGSLASGLGLSQAEHAHAIVAVQAHLTRQAVGHEPRAIDSSVFEQ